MLTDVPISIQLPVLLSLYCKVYDDSVVFAEFLVTVPETFELMLPFSRLLLVSGDADDTAATVNVIVGAAYDAGVMLSSAVLVAPALSTTTY